MSTERVWSELRGDLAAFLRGRVRDEHRAEDVLQETFVRVHDALTRVEGGEGGEEPERLQPWVRRIARNVLIDLQRADRGEGELDPRTAGTPEEAAGNRNAEVQSWLPDMIAALPPDLAEAVRLSELEGLPQTEVAARLGLSHSGAKSRVQRARARLREQLLACCQLEFDRRGNVVDYERRGQCHGCSR